MPTELPRVITLLATHVDHDTNDVLLTVRIEGETSVNIRIHPGVVGGLGASLMGLAASTAPTGPGQFVGQVMYLTAAIPAIGPQGQKILDLVLEGGMHFPVSFPDHAIPILRKALAELEKPTTTRIVRPARH